jgi:hypothetical protein
MVDELRRENYDAATITRATEFVTQQIEGESRKACTDSLRKRFLGGEFTEAQVTDQLTALGWDARHSQAMAKRWSCERAAQGKETPLATIKQLLEFKVINEFEAIERIENLNFKTEAAFEIVLAFGLRLNEQRQKEFNAALRKIKADHKRELARLERLANRETKSREKSSNKGKQDADKRIKEVQKLMTKAKEFAEATSGDYDAISTRASKVVAQMERELGLTHGVAVNIVISSFKLAEKSEGLDWAAEAVEIGRAVADSLPS